MNYLTRSTINSISLLLLPLNATNYRRMKLYNAPLLMITGKFLEVMQVGSQGSQGSRGSTVVQCRSFSCDLETASVVSYVCTSTVNTFSRV